MNLASNRTILALGLLALAVLVLAPGPLWALEPTPAVQERVRQEVDRPEALKALKALPAPEPVKPVPAAARKAKDGPVQANLENLPLKDFIRFVGQFTGKSVVFREESVPYTKVTLISGQAANEPELMAIFHQVLQSAGLYAVLKAGVIYVLQAEQARAVQAGLSSKPGKGPDEELVTTVLRPGRVSAAEAARLMAPFKSEFGVLSAVPRSNALLIKDTRSRVREMIRLIGALPAPGPAYQTEVVGLQSADALEAAAKVDRFYQDLTRQGTIGRAPVVLAVD
ncbi:MAG: hypothetical protein PHV85_04790, partial [Desulfovibrionaceae bacterium]|nr:hypothetical protein [Desulfovibrionaceae bacterium]